MTQCLSHLKKKLNTEKNRAKQRSAISLKLPSFLLYLAKKAAYSILLHCLAISSNLTNLLLGSAYIFIRRVSSEVQRRVFDAVAPAEHGPVPSNHSASGGLASAATSPLHLLLLLPHTSQITVRELLTNWCELAAAQFIAQP